VGYVPGFPGAHSQGATLDELHANLRELIAMLLEDGEPKLETEFVGTRKPSSFECQAFRSSSPARSRGSSTRLASSKSAKRNWMIL
jgi:predicted RNase H-like HicB family nuclease